MKALRPRFLYLLGLALVVLCCSRGLIEGLLAGRLPSGHDSGLYPMYLQAFDANVRAGNLVPLWASAGRFGFGEPLLAFRPPLQLYAAELVQLVSGNLFTSLAVANMLVLLAAALGMFFFVRALLDGVFGPFQERRHDLPALVSAAMYLCSPYVLTDIYVRGAYSETAAFAVFPWLALALWRLARAQPGSRAANRDMAAASAAIAALCLSHSAIHLVSTGFLALGVLIYRREIRDKLRFAGACALGFAASSFYWAVAFFERHDVKSALRDVDYETYIWHFKHLYQFLYSAWSPAQEFSMGYSLGLAAWFGLGFALWDWARDKRDEAPASYPRLSTALACAMLLGFYFMHRLSALWYEAIPPLRVIQFPWRLLSPLTFFGTTLATLTLEQKLRARPRAYETTLKIALIACVLYGFYRSEPSYFRGDPLSFFSESSIRQKGVRFIIPDTEPIAAAYDPTQASTAEVETAQGSAQSDCHRLKPTLMECTVSAANAATLRFHTFDYPGWTTMVDGRVLTPTRHDLASGELLASVDSGKHVVRWELLDSPCRRVTKVLSFLAWVAIVFLAAHACSALYLVADHD